jgi:dTDP-glucose pyrophosphorylase
VKAVVLAAGRGSRMQASGSHDPPLDPGQRAAAEAGRKTLIPFHGHPFLSHILSALADGGVREVCLVVGPGEDPVRRHYAHLSTNRLRIDFAVQDTPTGSAHAVLAAESFAGSDPFLVVNGDNLYPPGVVAPLVALEGDGLVGFSAVALSGKANIPLERIAAFALLEVGADGCLRRIMEKPTPEEATPFGPDPMVSMTCWRFTPPIFDACRRVPPSPRGEFELPDAVRLRVEEGACFQVVPSEAGVLDLTRRGDIPGVEGWLQGREVRL